MPEIPPGFFQITIGDVILWVGGVFAACKLAKSVRTELKKAIVEIYDEILGEEEEKIGRGERTRLVRVIETVYGRITGLGG